MQYDIHPLCKILPEMSADEYNRLVVGIKAKGLMRPITLFDGMILDGRHRYRACEDAGVTPRFDQYEGDDPAGFVAESCNHRNLNATQRALIATGFLEYERERAKTRQRESGEKFGVGKIPENFPEPIKGRGEARDIAGARMGISGQSVSTAARVLESAAPEVIEEMRNGHMALNEAKKIVHLNKDAQRRIASLPKQERQTELVKSTTRSVMRKQRDRPRMGAPEIGTPFLRVFLSSLERLAMYCAEQGIRSGCAIAAQFERDMDWSSAPLVAQYERCIPVLDALDIIREQKAAA